MYRVSRFRLNRSLVGLVIIILFSAVLFPITIIADQGDKDNEHSSRGTRATLTVEENTVETLKNSNYDWIWVKDDATLIFDSGINEIKGRLNVTDNGSVVIKKGSKVTAWSVTAHCKSFIMEGGILDCKNGKSYPDHGISSIVIIHTQEGIEISGKAKIIVGGLIGLQSNDEMRASFNGGEGKVELISDKYIRIIGDSEINCTGGPGGSGVEIRYKGGNGGNGIVKIQANGTNKTLERSIQIDESTINAYGGPGGPFGDISGGYYAGDGGNGGDGKISIISRSNDEILIEKSTIKAMGGSGGFGPDSSGDPGDAPLDIKCKKLYVDKYKDIEGESTWFDETTYLVSSVEAFPPITIDAPTEAKLWVPNFGKDKDFKLPKAASGTTIELYHTLQVTAISNTGDKLPVAPVEVKLGDSTEVKNSDANGIVFFLKPAYKITKSSQGAQVWSVTADYAGAEGTYPGGVTLPNRHNEIDVKVTLITVSIDTIKFANKLYSAQDMVVYGLVTIEGTTAGPNAIKSVEIKIGSISAAATDISGSEPEFTKWSYVWDTRTETPRAKFKIESVATDENDFSDNDFINLTVAQTPVPPIVTVSEPENNLEFKDRVGSPGLVIKGTVYDPNRDSKLLEHSKNVMKVIVTIKKGGSILFTATLTTESGLKYYATENSFNWSTTWPTATMGSGGKFEYPNGEYTIEVTAADDTKPIELISSVTFRNLTLKHIQKPVAGITDITAVKNAKRIDVYSPTGFDTTKIFKFESKKGASEVTLNFDLSASIDPDGSALLYYLDTGDNKIYRWINTSNIKHEFIHSVSKKKEIKNYQVIIKVKDEDNAESEHLIYGTSEVTNLTIIIEFIPEDPAPTIMPDGFTLPLDRLEIQILFLIMLIAFNLAAAMMIISKKKKISKRRRAREAVLESARKKQLGEEDKKKEDIYSHLQFEEAAPGEKQVAVAGSAAAMALPTDEAITASTEQQSAPVEPEAPELISVEQPVYESETTLDSTPGTSSPTTEALPAPAAPAAPELPAAPAQALPAQVQVQPQAPAAPAQAATAQPLTEQQTPEAAPQPQTQQPKQQQTQGQQEENSQ